MSIETKGPSHGIRSLAREVRERIHSQNGQPATGSTIGAFLRESTNNRIRGSFDDEKPCDSRPVFPVYRRNNYGGTYGGPGKNRLPWS